MIAVTIILIGIALSICTADNLRLRYRLRKLKEENAARVAAALGDMAEVDGVTLPQPDDERWSICAGFTVGKEKDVSTLQIRHVYVTQFGIYVGDSKNVPALPPTVATKNYCAAVWKAYRSRVARKAIETTS